jgi:hypothetical protein
MIPPTGTTRMGAVLVVAVARGKMAVKKTLGGSQLDWSRTNKVETVRDRCRLRLGLVHPACFAGVVVVVGGCWNDAS